MPQIGQASGGFTESSSALRILHVGIRNSVGVLSSDAFTQNNPAGIKTQISAQADVSVKGVLSGSVAFVRPDADGGADVIGGVGSIEALDAIGASASFALGFKPLGVFVNSANGNPFENQPGVASGKGTYVSGLGCYGNQLFETKVQQTADGVNAGTALVYVAGVSLVPSINGFLMPEKMVVGGAHKNFNLTGVGAAACNTAEAYVSAKFAAGNNTWNAGVIGVLKMPADSAQNELIYDQRI